MARILVVDDHVANCQPLVKLFRFAGHVAVCAESGPAALSAMAVDAPDVVLLDLMMPDMDGFEVLKRIRADSRFGAVAVLMYTAVTDPEVQTQAIEFGAQGYVVKGTGFELLREAVRRHLRGSPPPPPG